MTDKKPKFTREIPNPYFEACIGIKEDEGECKRCKQEHGYRYIRCHEGEIITEKLTDEEIFEQGKLAGKKELAQTILSEGYAVAHKQYIAFEVERLKSQIKETK